MHRFLLFLSFVLAAISAQAQGTVKGRILDKQTDEVMQFVNIKITDSNGKIAGGGMTDIKGSFQVGGLKEGSYTLQVSFVGYKTVTRRFQISKQQPRVHYNAIYISEDSQTLKEVQVVGQRSQMKLEVDRKTFSVDEVLAAAGGSVTDLLENIPSVEVTTDGEISLRGNSSVEVWINGKQSGLTSDNRAEILQQIPAESIERIEVIDNPSAKFSPEGTAGIINIILKRDRKAGYYGSLQAGANNHNGWNVGGNINYSSKWMDAYVNLGYRKRRGSGGNLSDQRYRAATGSPFTSYQQSEGDNNNNGGGLFARAGLTFHLSANDDLTLSGMTMQGNRESDNLTTYRYGTYLADGTQADNRILHRQTWGDGDNHMYHAELGYTHKFNEQGTHKLDLSLAYNNWNSDSSNEYLNDTTHLATTLPSPLSTYSYQYRPMNINNRSWEAKADYENQISENFKIETGYNGNFSHENTPQSSFEYSATGTAQRLSPQSGLLQEDPFFYNRFIYDMNVHALYATANMKFGKLGVMAGLRGEYWRVDTKSIDYYQTETPFKKDFFQLFPSLFLNYALSETAQIQLNYTRRLRRPWGGQLNSFKNTRDASMIEFGNPELTPEYTNAFALNFLKSWEGHTLSVGTYYRPTTDVIQRIRYQGADPTTGQDVMYMTNLNVAKSQSAGIEIIGKDKLWKILDLTTTLNGYYYRLDGFEAIVENQLVTGQSDENFAWDARLLASLILPYDISLQATGNYRSRSVITQGYRKANGSLDLGLRKTFFNKMFSLALNWRDVFKTRKFENYTEGPTFWRHQRNWRDPRINIQLTWNFGNMNQKKKPQRDDQQGSSDEDNSFGGYEQ
ncbi:MAG: TonB-dependent receptor [Prevotella sp.]|nr:TonB-dependent receptor [Prevotella sp.]